VSEKRANPAPSKSEQGGSVMPNQKQPNRPGGSKTGAPKTTQKPKTYKPKNTTKGTLAPQKKTNTNTNSKKKNPR